MERKFKVTIGDKTVIVTVEEIMEAATSLVQRTQTKPKVTEKTKRNRESANARSNSFNRM
jgi:hypothetical protein